MSQPLNEDLRDERETTVLAVGVIAQGIEPSIQRATARAQYQSSDSVDDS